MINTETVNLYFADWNGDGRTDVLTFHLSTGTNRFYINNTVDSNDPVFTQVGASSLISNSLLSGGSNIFLTDWNGDGLLDILWYKKEQGSTKWFANTGDGNNLSFAAPNPDPISTSDLQGGDGIRLGNWNGDGLVDLMWYNLDDGETKWYFNKGDLTFLEATLDLDPTEISLYKSLFLLDVNGDGYDDIVLYDQNSGKNRWLINDGRCQFNASANTNIPDAISPGDIDQGTSFSFGGFSGESVVDAFWYDKDGGENYFFKSKSKVSNLVDTIIAGNGFTVAIDYRPLTDEELYTKENDAVYPEYDFQNKLYVVSSYTVNNGIGGRNKMSYKYKGAKMNLHGRGFRGFTEVHIKDETTGVTSSKFMNRDYRYIGSPLQRAETRLDDGTLISETVNKDTLLFFYNNNNNLLSTHFAYTYESVSKTYELDGSLISSITTRTLLDDYGNLVKTVVDYGGGYIDSTYNEYEYSGFISNWFLGRLVRSEVTKFAPGQPSSTKASAFEYDLSTGLLVKEISEPDRPFEERIEKTYVHDDYGNIIQSTVSFFNGVTLESRNTYTSFDDSGRFLISATNDLGHSASTAYDPVLGHKLTETDANGLVVSYQYDPYGRLIRTDYPDGTWATQSYMKCEGDCPPGAVFYLLNETVVDPPQKEYYDILGREIMMESVGFNGDPIFEVTEYNEMGLISRKSDPYYQGNPILWTELEYDALAREITITEPGDLVNQTIYNGLTTTQINPKGQSKTIIKNIIGQIVRSTDNQGNSITYQYDAAGNLTQITDPLGNTIQMAYDIYSNKISMVDPDMGAYSYTYNAIGELLSQTDPKGNIVEFAYDVLGRMIQKTEPEGETNWVYDTQEHGIGLLAEILSDGYDYNYEVLYDELSRIYKKKETIEGQDYETSFYFDPYGRPQSVYYPYGYGIRYTYNEFNYLSEVGNLAGDEVYWQVNEIDAKGQLTRQTFGNNTSTHLTYNSETNWLESIYSSNPNTIVQDLSYSYDPIGNLTQRTDALQSLTEIFSYDDLNRLSASIIPSRDTLSMNYDIIGNITFKSDVGHYFYRENGAGPHQLTRIEGNGSQPCIPSSITDFTYTSFNKVKTITLDNSRLEIQYAPTYQRTVQKYYANDTLVKTKIHIGNSLEIEVTDTLTRALFYIRGIDGVVAVHNQQTNGVNFTHYWHKDHLGSLQAISNEEGQVVQVLSYDPWGKRRNPDGTPLEEDLSYQYDRGFSGHEHLDLFDLINMNGRIYDPVIGRFISPDPFIQDETDLQNLNRYSYVLNNPLSYNDPSGFFWGKIKAGFKKVGGAIKKGLKKTARVFVRGAKNIGGGFKQVFKGDIWGGLKKIAKGYLQTGGALTGIVGTNEVGKEIFGEGLWNSIVVAAASIAVSVLTLPAGGSGGMLLCYVMLSGAASGFTAGSLSTMLAGGSFTDALLAGVKGAVISGAMASATFGIGSLAQGPGNMFVNGSSFAHRAAHYGVKMVGHGVLQGGMSQLRGGDFIHGLSVGAFTSITGPIIDQNFSSLAGQTVAAAVAGGTASVIGGGKFVNGALSGAMIRLYNDRLHQFIDKVKLHSRFLLESFADSSGDVAAGLTIIAAVPGPQSGFFAIAAGSVGAFNAATSAGASFLNTLEGNGYSAFKYGASAALGGVGRYVQQFPI